MAAWRQRLAPLPTPRVGLCWAGAPRRDDPAARAIDRRRSITLAHYAPLAHVSGATFVALQKGDAAAQAAAPPTGLPVHDDNKTIIKERIYVDKSDPDTLWDDITMIDNAYVRPWTLHKKAVRTKSARPVWYSEVCEENNSLLRIGNEAYFLSAEGYLMPSKKNQSPPDLRYFQSK